MLNERTLWKTYTIAARQKVEQYFDSNQQLLLQAKYYDELLHTEEETEGRFEGTEKVH